MLLIVSMRGDYHVSYLMERMAQSHRDNTVVFHTETFPMESSIVLRNYANDSYLQVQGRSICLGSVSSIWYRRPAHPIIAPSIVDVDARKYAEGESWDALLGLWEGINGLLVSKPSSIRSASHKWEQIRRAQKLGFKVPKTLITNNPKEARQFCGSVGATAVKAVLRSVIAHKDRHEAAYTTPIDFDDPRIEDVDLAPCIFQEYVPKQLELRITVVSDSVFACAIHSQRSDKTKHAWRNYDLKNTPHESWVLPKDVERKCKEMVRSYGLNFSAIDMILTPDGEYVFLELNPNGQWAWIDELTDLPIAEALIRLLFSPAPA